jgi:hypothetical protein
MSELEELKLAYAECSRQRNELLNKLKSQAQRKPLTDEEFLELILRTGTQELVGVAAFVGGSIQMRGKIGLLRSAKVIKEFVEAAHGIKEDA